MIWWIRRKITPLLISTTVVIITPESTDFAPELLPALIDFRLNDFWLQPLTGVNSNFSRTHFIRTHAAQRQNTV
jgi:hypothetical protein